MNLAPAWAVHLVDVGDAEFAAGSRHCVHNPNRTGAAHGALVKTRFLIALRHQHEVASDRHTESQFERFGELATRDVAASLLRNRANAASPPSASLTA